MPRLELRIPAYVVVVAYDAGAELVRHLPLLPEELLEGRDYAPTLCGGFGDVWARGVWNRSTRTCRFCRRNAAAVAALFQEPAQPALLVGPERSEGPTSAPRRQPGSSASVQAETLPANDRFSLPVPGAGVALGGLFGQRGRTIEPASDGAR